MAGECARTAAIAKKRASQRRHKEARREAGLTRDGQSGFAFRNSDHTPGRASAKVRGMKKAARCRMVGLTNSPSFTSAEFDADEAEPLSLVSEPE